MVFSSIFLVKELLVLGTLPKPMMKGWRPVSSPGVYAVPPSFRFEGCLALRCWSLRPYWVMVIVTITPSDLIAPVLVRILRLTVIG
jgi:hypothetical protein